MIHRTVVGLLATAVLVAMRARTAPARPAGAPVTVDVDAIQVPPAR